MSLPQPQYPLEDVCSVIFNNTLFTYSREAFQSLPLVQGAQWTDLPMGEMVKGGVCVQTTPVNDTSATALYIIGGTSNTSDYEGMQKYTFSLQKWESVQPTVPVAQNRLYHGAVYLNSSDTILVYAGTQDGTMQPSSQTFTIQASEPYAVLAYQAIAPPAISPLLMQWTESKALYVGGSNTNTMAMIFSPSTSWVNSNATLADPLYNISNIHSIVQNGDDSSKTLYTFDMAVSPNVVNRTILYDGNGNPVQNAKPIVGRGLEILPSRTSILGKRDGLTVADWPAYNDSLVPTTTRTAYSVAKDQSGLVVLSGGNTEDVLCMFKARENCWVNATQELVSDPIQQGPRPSLSPSSTTTLSSGSQKASAQSTGTGTGSPGPDDLATILAAVLGSIVGMALILLAVLLLLRWRRKRRQYVDAGHQRRSSGIPNEKDTMDFSDMGLPPMSSTRQLRNHAPQDSQASFSSVAILMGRVGGHKRSGERGDGSVGSDASSHFNKKYKTAISNPIPQEPSLNNFGGLGEPSRPLMDNKIPPIAEEREVTPRVRYSTRGGRRGSTRRSSGWNRYWSGGSAMNIFGFGNKRSTYGSDDSNSQYSDYRPSRTTQTSAVVPPLRLGQPELNRVPSGSPTVANAPGNDPLSREMSGQIERPGSEGSMSSYNDDDRRDAFSSGVPASLHEHTSWTPVDRHDWAGNRVPSNAYTESIYAATLPRSTVANFPRETQFPPPPSYQNQQRPPNQQSTISDMSWLNLGGDSRL